MTEQTNPPIRPTRHYQPTPIPGLLIYPSVWLLNLIVMSDEANIITDGRIPVETVDTMTNWIRHAYNLPDLDVTRGHGVALSFIGQFFHPDDYRERRIAKRHAQGLVQSLRGDLRPLPLKVSDLRASQMPPSQRGLRTLRAFYKQRFLSLCFVGEQEQLDKLQDQISAELLSQVLDVLWQGVGLDDTTFVAPHPAFVPAARLRQVSQQNAATWAKNMNRLMQEQKLGDVTVTFPRPTRAARPRRRR
jgi:hypothetical protein